MNIRSISILALLVLTACGGSTSKDSDNNGTIVINNDDNSAQNGMTGTGLDCEEVCPEKEAECGAPEGAFQCSMACAALTPGEVECLNDAACGELATADSVEELCEGAQPSNNTSNNTSNGMTGGGSCEFSARCEGDELVTCEEGDLGTVTQRMRCTGGCENGECLGAPTEVTITGPSDSAEPITVEDEGVLISSLTLQGEPIEHSTELPDGVDIHDDTVTTTIVDPDPGACQVSLTTTLNRSAMSVGVLGEDTLPDTDCFDFATEVGENGITLLLEDVPYLNIGGTVDLTMEIEVR